MSSIYLPDSESVIDVMDTSTIGDPESFVLPVLRRADFAFAGRQNMIESGVIAQGSTRVRSRAGCSWFSPILGMTGCS